MRPSGPESREPSVHVVCIAREQLVRKHRNSELCLALTAFEIQDINMSEIILIIECAYCWQVYIYAEKVVLSAVYRLRGVHSAGA